MSYSSFQIVSIGVHFDAHILLTFTIGRYIINILGQKRSEMSVKKIRLQIGLDKISETKRMVADMQEELVVLQPQLVRTQSEGTYGWTCVRVKMCVCVHVVRYFLYGILLFCQILLSGVVCTVSSKQNQKSNIRFSCPNSEHLGSLPNHPHHTKKAKNLGNLPLFYF